MLRQSYKWGREMVPINWPHSTLPTVPRWASIGFAQRHKLFHTQVGTMYKSNVVVSIPIH